jgi:hypothetical protein
VVQLGFSNHGFDPRVEPAAGRVARRCPLLPFHSPRESSAMTQKNGPRYNVQISRLYKDQHDKWKDSTSFSREDLPLVAKVADLAMVWIYENPAAAEK